MADFIGKTTEVEFNAEPKIDLKDRKILSVLSRNCRLTPTQIGKMVGLSKEVVSYRIKNLEKKKVIREYITIMNPAKIGIQIFVVYLQMQNLSQEKEDEIIHKLIEHKATHYIVHTIGKYDFIFDVLAHSISEFDNILRELLKELGEYVKNYEISPVIDVVKYVHLTESFSKDIKLNPIKFKSDSSFMKELENLKIDYNLDNIRLDKTDQLILSCLSTNAKLQLKDIAKKSNISDDTVKYRIKNLIKKNIIVGFLPIINISMLGYHNYGVLIELNNIEHKEKDKLFQHLAIHPDVYFFLKTSGQYEIALNISIKNNLHLHQFITVLKQKYAKQIKTIEVLLFLKDYKMVFLS